MNGSPDPQNNVGMIHEALEEIHTMLSNLETQLKPEPFFDQAEMNSVETMQSEEQMPQGGESSVSSILEDEIFLGDWL